MGAWLASAAGITTSVLVLAAGAAFLAKGVRWMLRTLRKVNDFLDDWRGEPARPGVAARPGVMQRIEHIEAQLKPNGGSSVYDKVTRIAESVDPQ